MTVYYADTSALLRAYFVDEPGHQELSALLLAAAAPVVTSELARVEFASATTAATRAGRLRRPRVVLDRFDADCGDDGPITLVSLVPETALGRARELVQRHRLRTLDAIHLAVALFDLVDLAGDEPLCLVTRDADQAAAAQAMGMDTA